MWGSTALKQSVQDERLTLIVNINVFFIYFINLNSYLLLPFFIIRIHDPIPHLSNNSNNNKNHPKSPFPSQQIQLHMYNLNQIYGVILEDQNVFQ